MFAAESSSQRGCQRVSWDVKDRQCQLDIMMSGRHHLRNEEGGDQPPHSKVPGRRNGSLGGSILELLRCFGGAMQDYAVQKVPFSTPWKKKEP